MQCKPELEICYRKFQEQGSLCLYIEIPGSSSSSSSLSQTAPTWKDLSCLFEGNLGYFFSPGIMYKQICTLRILISLCTQVTPPRHTSQSNNAMNIFKNLSARLQISEMIHVNTLLFILT